MLTFVAFMQIGVVKCIILWQWLDLWTFHLCITYCFYTHVASIYGICYLFSNFKQADNHLEFLIDIDLMNLHQSFLHLEQNWQKNLFIFMTKLML
jgi:hypothetical protein